MDTGLKFDVRYKAKDLIQVRVFAWSGTFGGTADIYAGIGRLEEIAAQIDGFPADISDRREIIMGAFGPRTAGGIEIRFYCKDSSGHAYAECKIDSGSLSGRPPQSVSLVLAVEAAAVDAFVEELRKVGIRRSGIARLAAVADIYY